MCAAQNTISLAPHHFSAFTSRHRYNYTGEEFFVKKKDRGFRHVTSTAKLIIREALPIQCVEAVFVGAYLTADMTEVCCLFRAQYREGANLRWERGRLILNLECTIFVHSV